MKIKTGLLITTLLLLLQVSMAQTETKATFPLIVSFESQCCGVPKDSAIRKFITEFKKKYKIKHIAANRIGPMGREGEYYLAFPLSELNKKQLASFISGIKKVKKLMTDKGSFSFREKVEIDFAALPGRSMKNIIVF